MWDSRPRLSSVAQPPSAVRPNRCHVQSRHSGADKAEQAQPGPTQRSRHSRGRLCHTCDYLLYKITAAAGLALSVTGRPASANSRPVIWIDAGSSKLASV